MTTEEFLNRVWNARRSMETRVAGHIPPHELRVHVHPDDFDAMCREPETRLSRWATNDRDGTVFGIKIETDASLGRGDVRLRWEVSA